MSTTEANPFLVDGDGYCSCYGPGDCSSSCGIKLHRDWKPGDPWVNFGGWR